MANASLREAVSRHSHKLYEVVGWGQIPGAHPAGAGAKLKKLYPLTTHSHNLTIHSCTLYGNDDNKFNMSPRAHNMCINAL